MRQPKIAKHLLDVVQAAEMAERLAGALSFEQYVGDDAIRLAVERLFITIGEALAQAQKIAPEAVAEIGHVREIIGFRNILVHGYAVIDDRVVWNALQQHLPPLRTQVVDMLSCSDRG